MDTLIVTVTVLKNQSSVHQSINHALRKIRFIMRTIWLCSQIYPSAYLVGMVYSALSTWP